MTDSVRRSGRARKQNPRYSTKLADEYNSEEFAIQPSSNDASSFEHDTDKEDEDEDASMDEPSASEPDETAADIAEDHFSEEDVTEVPKKTRAERPAIHKPIDKQGQRHYVGYQADGTRSRGCLFHPTVRNREVTIREIAGDDELFIDKMKNQRDQFVETLTVPFRKNAGYGKSGLCYPEVYSEEIREAERHSFLQWYQDRKGWKLMAEAQSTRRCDLQSRELYIDTERPPQHLLLGPYDAQHYFDLNLADSISLSQAWHTAISTSENNESHDESSCDRPGWILNLGSRVLSMDWAPNQNGDYQFLAVSVQRARPARIPEVTAFEPTQPFETSVQIWAFSTNSNNSGTPLNANQKPKLVHVICVNWGTIRRLSWCPAAVSIPENDKSIGLLATISTDGFIRVVDVCVDLEANDPYVIYETAVLASKPPDTICTCLAWIGASQLAAGCANGYVAIWDVAKRMTATDSVATNSSNAIPSWYHAQHTTYIISIVAIQPYPCQYITTNAVNGYLRVSSIRNPYADTVYAPRERHLTPPLCAAPHILGFYEIDEIDGIRGRSLRHIPLSRAVVKATAQVLCVDAGKAHPCVIVGSADGNALITNPLRKVFIRRFTPGLMPPWQQTWFKHEFVPSTRVSTTAYSSSLLADSEKRCHAYPREGVSRFLESLTLEKISMSRIANQSKENNNDEMDVEEETLAPDINPVAASDKQEQNIAVLEDGQVSIYEEEQAVTCLSWNINVRTGGWAAAGMANGLLRVEDLAV